jgi:hypothetical protein
VLDFCARHKPLRFYCTPYSELVCCYIVLDFCARHKLLRFYCTPYSELVCCYIVLDFCVRHKHLRFYCTPYSELVMTFIQHVAGKCLTVLKQTALPQSPLFLAGL